MNNNKTTAIIAGSTGLTGTLLLRELLRSDDFAAIKVITRRPLNINDPRVLEVPIKDLQEIHIDDPRFQADIYFCCLGTTIKKAGTQEAFRKVDFDAVKSFAEVAKVNNARAFIMVSAMGANPQSLIFYNRVKGEAECAVRERGIAGTVIFRPSLLLGNRQEQRFAEGISIKVVESLSQWLPLSWQKKLGTKVEDLIKRMISEAKYSEKDPKIIEAAEI